MNDPLIIRAPQDHFHLRIGGKWHRNQTRHQARHLLWDADLTRPDSLLADAIVPQRMVSDITYRRLGRHRWWVNGLPLPLKVVRYILMDEVGMSKEQCDLTIEALKLCDQCRQLRERIEDEAITELYRHCRECLHKAKSPTPQ